MSSRPGVRPLVSFGLIDQAPRAIFDDVEAQVFPLLADRRRLQHFLDQYYNRTLHGCQLRMEVVSPVVFFTALYYPIIHGVERAEAAIVNQHEYYFLIPIEYVWKIGNREERKLGVVTPYIYVSSPISAPLGRELYGWQKHVHRVSNVQPRGMRYLRHEPYLSIERPSPGRTGRQLEYTRVLELTYRSDASPLRWGGVAPLGVTLVGELPRVGALMARAAMSEFGGGREQGPGLWGQLQGLAGLLEDVLHPNEMLEVYSLVQFPHPSLQGSRNGVRTFAAAYQALMRTQLNVRNIRELALLGSQPPSPIDPSRGFTLRLSGHGVDQVVSRLGLQVWSYEQGSDGYPIHVVRPFHPMYARFDMELASLVTLTRRALKTGWRDNAGRRLGLEPPADSVAEYNVSLGPSSAEGFSSYGNTPQILRYKLFISHADAGALEALCRETVPTPPGVTLTPRRMGDDGLVVFLFTHVRADERLREQLVWFSGLYVNIGFLADLSYQGRSKLVLLETHAFTDNPHAFLVGRELLAANRWLAEIDMSPHSWFPPHSDPPNERHSISVRTEVLRTLYAGDRIAQRTLLDVHECGPQHEHGDSNPHMSLVNEIFGERQLAYMRVAAIPTMCERKVSNAMVRCNVEQVRFGGPGEELEAPTVLKAHRLRITSYESIPLVRDLGLRGTRDKGGKTLLTCDFGVEGSLYSVRRDVRALYEWTDDGWWHDEIDHFLDGEG